LEINQKYLEHDFYTDIITFDLSETGAVRGEIYISIDRVRENARKLGVSFKSELHRVIFHGMLHLCGYNDKTKAEKEKIRAKEDQYLNKYNWGLASSH
jgi:rRNA maturation RNase YbeY